MKNTIMIEVIIGKTGSWKTTYLKEKLKNNKNLILLNKWTTRKPREDDFEYNFCTKNQFKSLLANEKLLEWTNFSWNYYWVEQFDYDKNEDYIVILEEKGLEIFNKVFKWNVITTRMEISEEERLSRLKATNDLERIKRKK